MADYPMTPRSASTPLASPATHTARTPAHASPDPHHVVQLLLALANVSRAELPDGSDRDVLTQLIRWGFVDNLYTPICADYHNIAWNNRPPWMDPRERISEWLAARRTWEQTGELAGQREQLAQMEGDDDGRR